MKKSVMMLVVAILVINVFTLGINIYSLTAKPITGASSSDTATISLYVQAPTPVNEVNETTMPGGSTGLYRTKNATPNGTAAQPNQIVPEKENPLPINKTFDVYPILGGLALVALVLVVMWLLIKHMRSEREKGKNKARARKKTRKKR
jgi:hypothetical protein